MDIGVPFTNLIVWLQITELEGKLQEETAEKEELQAQLKEVKTAVRTLRTLSNTPLWYKCV